MKNIIKNLKTKPPKILCALFALFLLSGMPALAQGFWIGSATLITNATFSSCVATTYTTVQFPGAFVQITDTNGATQLSNSFACSFTQSGLTPSNTLDALPATFNAAGNGTQLVPWTTNINYPPTNILVTIYWYFVTQPAINGGSNYSMQAQP